MQIGHGKQGVIVGEYGCERPESSLNPARFVESGMASPDKNAVIGWIEPACEKPAWILWFTRRGDAILHRIRGADGAVLDEPIRIKAQTPGRATIFYGPFACDKCAVMVCREEYEHGGELFTYPDEGPIYPNTEWVPHVCQQRDVERVNGLLGIGFRRPGEAPAESPSPSEPKP